MAFSCRRYGLPSFNYVSCSRGHCLSDGPFLVLAFFSAPARNLLQWKEGIKKVGSSCFSELLCTSRYVSVQSVRPSVRHASLHLSKCGTHLSTPTVENGALGVMSRSVSATSSSEGEKGRRCDRKPD